MEETCDKSSFDGRKVGVELEFGGIHLKRIIELVQGVLGGSVESKSRYSAIIRGSRLGKVKVELDAVLFTEFKLRGMLRALPIAKDKRDITDLVEKALASEARRWVPFEVVFEPLPFDRINELEAVRAALAVEAEGTGASVYNAFGLHFNPELPQADAPAVLRYLRSFHVLYESLLQSHEVDLTRRISPFIDPFPRAYVKMVLGAGYDPDEKQLIDDYLDHNATRNRPLDLLPILAHLDEELVRRRLPKEKINSRPTLHYRLPNCRIDDPKWTIAQEWEVYLQVENLAQDQEKLAQRMSWTKTKMAHPLRTFFKSRWMAIKNQFRAS